MNDTDTTKLNLYQKLLKITEAVGTIEKTGRNSKQNYSFIEQAQIVAELRPQLAKWGVMIMPETVSRSIERYDVTRSGGYKGVDIHANVVSRFTVINADKPDERFVCDWDGGEAIDSGDKATNKATTASQKYFLMKLFNISDKEDADGESPAAAPVAQRQAAPARPATAPTSNKATRVQIQMMLTAAKRASGLEDNKDVIAFFTDEVGTAPDKILKADVTGILKKFTAAQGNDGVQV